MESPSSWRKITTLNRSFLTTFIKFKSHHVTKKSGPTSPLLCKFLRPGADSDSVSYSPQRITQRTTAKVMLKGSTVSGTFLIKGVGHRIPISSNKHTQNCGCRESSSLGCILQGCHLSSEPCREAHALSCHPGSLHTPELREAQDDPWAAITCWHLDNKNTRVRMEADAQSKLTELRSLRRKSLVTWPSTAEVNACMSKSSM